LPFVANSTEKYVTGGIKTRIAEIEGKGADQQTTKADLKIIVSWRDA